MTIAELSSMSALLDDLLVRVAAIAERRSVGGEPDDVATGLFEVERSLREGRRRLQRVVELAG